MTAEEGRAGRRGIISGQVQGVGFRPLVCHAETMVAPSGWRGVQTLPPGQSRAFPSPPALLARLPPPRRREP